MNGDDSLNLAFTEQEKACLKKCVLSMASKVVIDSNPWPKIGVVGCGTIAAAVVEGLCRLGQNPPEKINLCPRSAEKTSKLASSFRLYAPCYLLTSKL